MSLSLDEDLSLGLGLSLESDLLCLSGLVRPSLPWFFRLSDVSLEWLLSCELFLEFTGVLSALSSFSNVVIWYKLVRSPVAFLIFLLVFPAAAIFYLVFSWVL